MASKNQTQIKAEPGKQELFIIREFDAPRELAFKAFIDPKIVVQWWGPKSMKMRIEKYDIKKGGSYSYVHSDDKGNAYSFFGVIHEVVAPELIVQTFGFENMPEKGHATLETLRFEALPGNRTRITGQSVFQSVASRDGMLQSGMEGGVNDSHQRLDEYFEKELVK